MRNMTEALLLGFICFILLFFLGTDTSPFYGDYFHYDASVYYVMGKSMLDGYRPYTDYFDNKGILLYCLYAAGIAIRGSRIGVFIIEWLFLFCSAMLVVRTAKRLNPMQRGGVCISLATFFMLYFSLSEGPLTENFSLPLQLLSIYLYANSHEDKRGIRHYCYGACLALLFFIRPNNICLTLAAILCELYGGGKVRLWHLGKEAVGLLVITMPILIIANNLGILNDMYVATISTNMRYRFDTSPTSALPHLLNFIRLVGAGSFSVVIFVADKNKRMASLSIASLFIITMAYCTGQSFKHYFMIVIPLLASSCSQLLKPQFRQSRYTLLALTFLPLFALHDMVLPGALKCAGKCAIECFNLEPTERIKNVQEKEKHILHTLERTVPNNERNQIYVYNYWEILWVFQHFRTLPINKYSTASINKLARYKNGLDKEIEVEFNRLKPLWIIATRYNLNYKFHQTLEREYNCMANMDEGTCLYKRKKQY